MNKKILFLVMIFLSISNVYAMSEVEIDKSIQKYGDRPHIVQHLKCAKESMFRGDKGNPEECFLSAKMIKDFGFIDIEAEKHFLGETYFNTGAVFDKKDDNLNAYKYYLKCAKNNGSHSIDAQRRLDRICKESPWICK